MHEFDNIAHGAIVFSSFLLVITLSIPLDRMALSLKQLEFTIFRSSTGPLGSIAVFFKVVIAHHVITAALQEWVP